MTPLVQSPFCNGRVSLLAGPTFLRGHFTRFPLNKNSCLKFRKNHVPSCRDQTEVTASLVIVFVSRIQIIGPRENNFVKWKETFRSDRLDQIRSVSAKGSHSQGETIRACAKAGWGQCFFFLSARRVTLLHQTGFLHVKGIKTFGYKTCNRAGIRKKFKIL